MLHTAGGPVGCVGYGTGKTKGNKTNLLLLGRMVRGWTCVKAQGAACQQQLKPAA
jgi:hypothetical protein